MAFMWDELAARHSEPLFLVEFFLDLEYLSRTCGNLPANSLADLIKRLDSKILHLVELKFAPAEAARFRAMLN